MKNNLSKKNELATVKDLLAWATENNRAVCGFNVNNMELIQSVTRAADELGVPVILQISKGARNYASFNYLVKLVKAAVSECSVPFALHLDHGDSFELCKEALDSGFTSVMIDGSHLPFEENIELTKRVVEYANKTDASVEGELGVIGGIEEEKQNDKSLYTDPSVVAEYITRTGVSSLAISIGTAHGAHKYKSDPNLRLDILAEIQKAAPNMPLVLHGASSVTPHDIEIINNHGGAIKGALGAHESVLAKTIDLGVRKINIDSDLRLAFTAELRQYMHKNPAEFDPRAYLGSVRLYVKELVKKKLQFFTVSQK